MAVLRQILTGTTTLASGSSTTTVTLGTALLDTSKAFIIAGWEPSSASPEFGAVSYQIISTTQIRFQRWTASGSPAINIQWYVVEFTSGVTVQRGSFASNATTINTTITAVDLAKSFAIGSYRSAGAGYSEDDAIELDLSTTTNLRARVNTTTTSNAVEWQVIEYADATVQTGRVTSWTTSSTTATVSSVNTSRSLLLFSYQHNGATAGQIGQKLVRGELTNATTLTFDRQATGCTIQLTWFLIEFTDATVQRGVATFGNSDTVQTPTLTTIDTARSLPILAGWCQAHGSSPYALNDHPGIASFTSALASSTQLTLTRGFTASGTAGATAAWQVLSFDAVAPTADLSGVIAATSTASGAIAVTKTLSSIITATSTASGAIAVVKTLSGAISGTSTLAGNLTAGGTLSGTIGATSTLAGSLSVSSSLSGAIAATSTIATAELFVSSAEFESLLPASVKDTRFTDLEQVLNRIPDLTLEPLNIYDFDAVEATALPHLGEQFNVMGYRGWLLADTEAKKRSLLKNAIELHRYAGTPYAVKLALNSLGFGNTEITENPGATYNGENLYNAQINHRGKVYGTFKVNLNIGGRSLSASEIALVTALINEWKNARSHLVSLVFTDDALYDAQLLHNAQFNYGGQPI